ncbi:hypothetical protein CAPTEDRAFT_90169, partial [Capitella teleta]
SLNNFLKAGSKSYMALVDSVSSGTQLGLRECQEQFKWERWNCPLKQSVLRPFNARVQADTVTKEISFGQAITCAGVAHTITKNCSSGEFENCRCDESKKGKKGGRTWKWGGCSDNLRFGERVSKLFFDDRVAATDAMATVNLHNNEVGRTALKKTMELICKCHGVSGSCTTKTCWQHLSDFRSVGTFLKRCYARAIDVDFQNGALQQTATRRHRRDRSELIRKTDLVYLQTSPDYCRVNGSYATLGRQCVRSSAAAKSGRRNRHPERKSCHRLCKACGLKVTDKVVEVTSSCKCKFKWCCEVACQQCRRKVELSTCTL